MSAEKLLILKPPLDVKKKNIVRDFVYGCWCDGRRIGGMQMPPLNDLYVATTARQRGVNVVFCDAALMPKEWSALESSNFAGVGAVGLMSSTQSFRTDTELLRQIKNKNPKIRSILFGSHPTFMPAFCLRNEAVDFIALGEPEESLAELAYQILNGGDHREVEGIGFRNPTTGEATLTTPRSFVNMDDLPIPDRTLLPKGVDYFNPVVWRMPYTTIQTSRGCPGKCTFCTVPRFYGKNVRIRSAENVLAELRILKDLGYREVFFRDETFTAYRERNLKICSRMVEEGLDLSWIANGRVDMVDKESMLAMKQAGCHMIKFGVETGNDHILQNYRKGTTTAQCRKVFADAHSVGLETHAHIVLGGPGESAETLGRTIEFVKELAPTTASFGLLTPYPGSDLFDGVAAHHPEITDGTDSNMDNLHVSGFYSQDICGMSGDELSKWLLRFYRKFYLRPSYLLRRLADIRSFSHFMTLAIAGLNIFSFSCTGKK